MHNALARRASRVRLSTLVLAAALASPAAVHAQQIATGPRLAPVGSFVLQPAGGPERDEPVVDEPSKPTPPSAFRIGPLVGVGVPSLVSLGLTAKVTRYVGLGVNIGLIPTVQVPLYGEATLSYREYDVYARIHPFGGGFFLGSGIGYERVTGSFSRTMNVPAISGYSSAQQFNLESNATVTSLVLTPKLGYLHTTDAGFMIGIDAGAQVPIAASETSLSTNIPAAVPATYTDAATAEVESTLRRVGQQVIPTLNITMGWLF
jgi:hypothetical protein